VGQSRHYPAQLGQPLQPADGRIAGLCIARQIIKDVLPVVRAHRDRMIGPAGVPAFFLFLQNGRDNGNHIGVAAQMFGFEE
jgi:hypothetical protein